MVWSSHNHSLMGIGGLWMVYVWYGCIFEYAMPLKCWGCGCVGLLGWKSNPGSLAWQPVIWSAVLSWLLHMYYDHEDTGAEQVWLFKLGNYWQTVTLRGNPIQAISKQIYFLANPGSRDQVSEEQRWVLHIEPFIITLSMIPVSHYFEWSTCYYIGDIIMFPFYPIRLAAWLRIALQLVVRPNVIWQNMINFYTAKSRHIHVYLIRNNTWMSSLWYYDKSIISLHLSPF